MSVNSVAGGSVALQTLQANQQAHKKQFEQAQQSLAQSLSSNDIQGAQKAYDTLSQLVQNGPGGKNGKSFGGNTTLQQDFAALGDALKSGDSNAAQKAFAQFTQDLQSAQQARRGGAGHESQRSAQVDSDGDYDNSPASGSVSLYA